MLQQRRTLRRAIIETAERQPPPPVFWRNGEFYHAPCRHPIQETNDGKGAEVVLYCLWCRKSVVTDESQLALIRRLAG